MNITQLKQTIRKDETFGPLITWLYFHIYPIGIYKLISRKQRIKRMHKNGNELIHEFMTLCDKASLEVFLFWGTLLGAVREHDFIPHDEDMDFGVFSEADFKTIKDIIKGTKFSTVCEYYLCGSGIKELKLSYKKTTFDIFLIEESTSSEEYFSCCYINKKRIKRNIFICDTIKYFFPKFSLIKVLFKDKLVFIPKQYKDILAAVYGNDYMTPNKKHISGSKVSHKEHISFINNPIFQIKDLKQRTE